MKTTAHKIIITLVCFIMSLMMFSAVFAAGENVQVYDPGVITGFEPAEYGQAVNTAYKFALIELEKEFPAQLTVRLGGEALYREENGSRILIGVKDPVTQKIDVSWKCIENYDEDLDVFHFVPDLGKYRLAKNLELPVITVNILGELPVPPLLPIPMEQHQPVWIQEESLTEKAALPSYYNGYEKGVLPPVRNQENYGICWAFSTIACVEADLIHDGQANTGIDLSELHLAYFTLHSFYDEKGLNAGDTVNLNGADFLQVPASPYYASYSLENMLGPVKESVVPYSLAPGYSPSSDQGRIGDYQITGVYHLDVINDRDSVKRAVMDHGGASALFNANTDFYSSTYNSYYHSLSAETNHSVTIVGWDDDFSRKNFRSGTPEGNGAWLVRNSWGVDGYNYHGYFWLSYYDKSLTTGAYAFDVQPWRYDHVYAYDNSLMTFNWEENNNSTIYAAQSFHVDGGEEIKAFSFYTEDPYADLTYTISSGDNKTDGTFRINTPGYYVIPLSTPLQIVNDSDVTVEYNVDVVSSKVRTYTEAQPGKYHYYTDETGHAVYFKTQANSSGMLINGNNIGCDAKIKLFTDNSSGTKAQKVSIRDASGKGISHKTIMVDSKTVRLKALVVPRKYVSQAVTWRSSNTKIAAVNAAGKVTFKKAGTVKITATAADGSGKSNWVKLKTNFKASKVSIRNTAGKAISHKNITVSADTYQLNVLVAPKKFVSQDVIWKSRNTDIATVDSTGLVTFLKAGTVKITAKATDGSGKANWVKLTYEPEEPVQPVWPMIFSMETSSEFPDLRLIESSVNNEISVPGFGNK